MKRLDAVQRAMAELDDALACNDPKRINRAEKAVERAERERRDLHRQMRAVPNFT